MVNSLALWFWGQLEFAFFCLVRRSGFLGVGFGWGSCAILLLASLYL